jgi:predicted CoA-binding protein
MHVDGLSDGEIRTLLAATKRIALVGASNKPERPSYEVMRFLLRRGFDVVPVNPGLAGQKLQGQWVVGSLEAAGPLDMVDLFRNAAEVGAPVAEAIRLGAKSIWMQLGVVNETAAAAAREAGLTVVMDRCPAIEMPRLGMV